METEQEHNLVTIVIEELSYQGSYVWIGLDDLIEDGTYVWETLLTPITYDKFSSGHVPANTTNCVAQTNGIWYEYDCKSVLPRVCETDPIV